MMRIEGTVLPKDPESGIRKLERAGKLGSEDALLALGRLYEEGTAVKKDPEKAFGYYLAASYGGSGGAAYHLGLLYITGTGTGKDTETGCGYLEDALEHGSADAEAAITKYCSAAPEAGQHAGTAKAGR